LILSFGGVFATEDDEDFLKEHKVTHHVMDRPIAGKLLTNREYVQPQWIVDSLNNLYLLPTQPYKPGQAPPPHLSPFIDDAKEGYVPTRQKEINQLRGEAVDDVDMDDDQDADDQSEDDI
jgi:pescadillo protein